MFAACYVMFRVITGETCLSCCNTPCVHVQHADVSTCLQDYKPGIVMKGFEPPTFWPVFSRAIVVDTPQFLGQPIAFFTRAYSAESDAIIFYTNICRALKEAASVINETPSALQVIIILLQHGHTVILPDIDTQ